MDVALSPGSSPLTRGKPGVWGAVGRSGRLIPAHAGKTLIGGGDERVHGAHPRSRGENSWGRCWSWRGAGSSPLTRGKRGHEPPRRRRPGLIPAHAGKTVLGTPIDGVVSAHPRSRGENKYADNMLMACLGSSPLTRGKPWRIFRLLRRPGLIPAHAGKTHSLACSSRLAEAHPRSRGENPQTRSLTARCGGSSPLTRGKLVSGAILEASVGLIPAHAGKTGHVCAEWCDHGAHPRSRGENVLQSVDTLTHGGSSPLTRGKQSHEQAILWCRGLIPAHAGKTRTATTTASKSGAHPRSRGENHTRGSNPALSPGSSPLTRGKHPRENTPIFY